MKSMLVATFFVILALTSSLYAEEVSFTQEDRERLIRLEATLQQFSEATDKRIVELREDTNKRFVELREDMNKRFVELREDMNKRFDQMMSFLWMITGIFTALTLGVIGFAYWDRRTIIRKAKEETIEDIEKEGRVVDLVNALREVAKTDPDVETILRRFHLL